LGVEQSDGIGDDFSVVVSSLSSAGVGVVLVVAPFDLIGLLLVLLGNSGLLVLSLGSGEVDSSGQDGDGLIELGNLGLGFGDSVFEGGLGVLVLADPVLVGLSLEFSRLGNLSDDVLAESNDLSDGRLVGLDAWGLGDFGQEGEDAVPTLLGVGVLLKLGLDVVGDLGEDGGDLGDLQEGGLALQGVGDDSLGVLNGVLGSVVLLLDLRPLLVLQLLLGVELNNSLVVQVDLVLLLVSVSLGLVSSGDLDGQLLGELFDSVLGLGDLVV